MAKHLTLALAVAWLGTATEPQQVKEDREDLAGAVDKTATLENYRFMGSVEIQGLPAAGPYRISGEYVQNAGFRYRLEPVVEIYRVGTKVVMAEGSGNSWVLLRPGHRYTDSPTGTQLAVLVRGLRPPHEDFAKLHERFESVRKRPEAEKVGERDCAVYEGDLNPSGARDFLIAGLSKMSLRGTPRGDASVWVGPDERIARIRADVSLPAVVQGRDLDVKMSLLVELFDTGKAGLTIPEEVRRLLDTATDEKKSDSSR